MTLTKEENKIEETTMTKEEKQLLLIGLCARLPYDVKGRVYAETTNGEYDINGDMIFFNSPFDVTLDDINTSTEEIHVIAIGKEDTVDFIEDQQIDGKPYTIDEFKPYLRPMSSMTEEENKDAKEKFFDGSDHYDIDDIGEIYADTYQPYTSVYTLSFARLSGYIDWLNSHYFDYLGLIEKGLAIEAPEGMYETE